MKSEISKIREVLDYSCATGIFTWKKRRGCRAAGAVAGSSRPNGYKTVFVNGRYYYAHRLAVYMVTGKMPEDVVDHLNGDRADNRWINLRACTQSENAANRRGLPQTNSKTGLLGASPHVCGKFLAQIIRNKKHRYIGLFDTPEEAHEAYKKAAEAYL